jgi:hypothetical protein
VGLLCQKNRQAGTTWYRNVTELERSLRAKDAPRPPQEPAVTQEASNDGGNGNVNGPVAAAETLPTKNPQSVHEPVRTLAFCLRAMKALMTQPICHEGQNCRLRPQLSSREAHRDYDADQTALPRRPHYMPMVAA